MVCAPATVQQRGLASQWKAASGAPLSRSHTISVWSLDAETTRLPSGVTATPATDPEWPSSVHSQPPVYRSQTFSVWSPDAETARWPSGVTATA